MAKMKWDLNGKGQAPATSGQGYSGPDLPKGAWPAKIKRMEVKKIGENKKQGAPKGANDGKPRISVLLEVQTNGIEGKEKYHGAPVWDGLNVIESSVPFLNAFLHALTDGSEGAKRAVEAAFWDNDKGPDFKRVKSKAGKTETHITKIGKYVINSPEGGHMITVTTRAGDDLKGNYRPEVTGYMPYVGEQNGSAAADSDNDDIDDEDDLLDDADDDYAEVDEDDDDDMDDDEDDADDDEDDDEDELDDVPVKASGRKPF